MFFNGFTLLMMIVGGGIGFVFSRWSLTTSYLIEALEQRVGSYYDNEGQVIINTGLYESAD
jgi:hypothetical protein